MILNRYRAKEWLPLLTAMSEGKQIQMYRQDNVDLAIKWMDVADVDVEYPTSHYRIAPEEVKITLWHVVNIFTGITCINSPFSLEGLAVSAKNMLFNPEQWRVVKLEGSYEK